MNLSKCSSAFQLPFDIKFIPLITSLLLLVFIATSSVAQDSQLVNPELFEKLLPENISPDFEKSSFSARTSPSENWGGAAYMGGGKLMQVGIRHFSPSAWEQNKAETKEDNTAIEVGNYTGYIGETMGQRELIVFFGNHFSARAVGANLNAKDLTKIISELPFEKINALAPAGSGSSKEETKKKPDHESLKTILPDTLAGMVHGRIRTAPNKSIIAVTYGDESIPYSVNIRLASGGAMKQAKANLKNELNEPNTDLQEINHNGEKLWFREEESAVSFFGFADQVAVIISADAPANISFDKKAARNHLLKAFDQLQSNL